MYAYIKGTLDSVQSDHVVIEAHGVGYRIYTSLSTISELPRAGEDVKLYTHFIVREDANMLCGFLTGEELNMFEILLSVSGVGPKVAIAVLSAVTPAKFGLAVMTEDFKVLTMAQGVGAKLAQKICFELKDKLKSERFADMGINLSGPEKQEPSARGKMVEAISALTILGYSQYEAGRAVSAVYTSELELEGIIKEALRQIGK